MNIKIIALLVVFSFPLTSFSNEEANLDLTREEMVYFLEYPGRVFDAMVDELFSFDAVQKIHHKWISSGESDKIVQMDKPEITTEKTERIKGIEEIGEIEEIKEIKEAEKNEPMSIILVSQPEEIAILESTENSEQDISEGIPQEAFLAIPEENAQDIILRPKTPMISASALNESFTTQLHTFSTIGMQIFEKINPRLVAAGYASGDKIKSGGPWIKIIGQHAIQKEHKMISGYHSNMRGLIGGADVFNEMGGIGAALSWSHLNIHHEPAAHSKTRVESYQGALYGNYQFRPLYLDWLAALAYNDYADYQQSRVGRYHGWQYGAKVEMGMNVFRKVFSVVPFTSLYYSYLDLQPYQYVVPKDMQMLQGGVGVKWIAEALFFNRHLWLQPEYRMMAFYDFIGDQMEATSQLTDAGPSFVTIGFKPEKTRYLLGITLSTFMLRKGVVLTTSYDFSFKSHYMAHTGFLKLHIQW